MTANVNILSDVKALLAAQDSLGRTKITNIYSPHAIFESSREFGHVRISRSDKFLLVSRQELDFSRLWFSSGISDIGAELSLHMSIQGISMAVMDLVGLENELDNSISHLERVGFRSYRRLTRLILNGPPLSGLSEDRSSLISLATEQDCLFIKDALRRNFDSKAEQIPSVEEIRKMIAARQVAVAKASDSGELSGFLAFEARGFTTIIRYWFVTEEMRGRGIGSALMNKVLRSYTIPRRTLLWVLIDNVQAREQYYHLGFKEEGLMDQVLIWGMN